MSNREKSSIAILVVAIIKKCGRKFGNTNTSTNSNEYFLPKGNVFQIFDLQIELQSNLVQQSQLISI